MVYVYCKIKQCPYIYMDEPYLRQRQWYHRPFYWIVVKNKGMKHVPNMDSNFRLDWNHLYLVMPCGVLKIDRISLNNPVSGLFLDNTKTLYDSSQWWPLIILKWWSAFPGTNECHLSPLVVIGCCIGYVVKLQPRWGCMEWLDKTLIV